MRIPIVLFPCVVKNTLFINFFCAAAALFQREFVQSQTTQCNIDAPIFQLIVKVIIRPFPRAGIIDYRRIGGVDKRRRKHRQRPTAGTPVIGTSGNSGVGSGVTDAAGNKDLRKYDVRINSQQTPIAFIAAAKEDGKYVATKSIGHCVDILAGSVLKAGSSDVLNVEKNVFVRTEGALNVTANIARLNIANDLIVEEDGTVTTVSKTAETKSGVNDMKVGHDIKNSGLITSDRNFAVMNDFIITATGELDSNGIPSGKENQVGNNFELSGKAAFARYTTTIVKGTFNSEAKSQFVREGLGASDVYRATVNVGKLGKTDGAAQGGWPTQM